MGQSHSEHDCTGTLGEPQLAPDHLLLPCDSLAKVLIVSGVVAFHYPCPSRQQRLHGVYEAAAGATAIQQVICVYRTHIAHAHCSTRQPYLPHPAHKAPGNVYVADHCAALHHGECSAFGLRVAMRIGRVLTKSPESPVNILQCTLLGPPLKPNPSREPQCLYCSSPFFCEVSSEVRWTKSDVQPPVRYPKNRV